MRKQSPRGAIQPHRDFFFPLRGGLDQVTPHTEIHPGRMIECVNYEIAPSGGYKPIDGFERFDGRLPSLAVFQYLEFSSGSAAILDGDTVTGSISGTIGVALEDAVVVSGDYGTGDAAGYIGVLLQSGEGFSEGEALQVAAVGMSTVAVAWAENVSANDTEDARYRLLAVEKLRSLIVQVPGEGPIRGVWRFQGVLYAFRDNVGQTAGLMYQANSFGGWDLVNLGRTLAFTSGGNTEIFAGDTIEGATSGATAVVSKVILLSGNWGTGTAEGVLFLSSQTGTFVAEEINDGVAANDATIAGDSVENTLAPGGKFRFENSNFGEAASSINMYGCDGVNDAFEYDGSIFTCITGPSVVGMKPKFIKAHAKQLFLGYSNGQVYHSPIGQPTGVYSAVDGASRIGLGDEMVDWLVLPGGVLGIWCKDSIFIISGTSSADWMMTAHTRDTGGIEGTAQRIGRTLFLSSAGIAELEATQAFGDFKDSTVSRFIDPLLSKKMGSCIGSCTIQAKNQYRLFFEDGSAIVANLVDGKFFFTASEYGIPVRCVADARRAEGEGTEVFFGSDDGYVYRMDSGYSLDDKPMQSFFRLPFSYLKTPSQKKVFKKVVVELDVLNQGFLSLLFRPDFSLIDADIPMHDYVDISKNSASPGIWNVSEWNNFYWSGAGGGGVAEGRLDGVATVISLMFFYGAPNTVTPPHVLNSVNILHQFRGQRR